MIIDKLIEKIKEKQNPTCVGLDTHIDVMPNSFLRGYDIESLDGCAKAVFEYNKLLIDSLVDYIPSVKLQNAYYEKCGIAGIEAYKKTIDYAHEANLIVIADVKRGDIGSTSAAYAKAHLNNEVFGADFMTINPYFGTDGVKPFIDDCKKLDKGLFILVKTSNPSSIELQDLVLQDGSKVYEKTSELVINWGDDIGKFGYNSIGAVVGATHKEEGINLRNKMKNTFFLIPGYGAQGATAYDLAGMFDENGIGGIVNSSRGIIGAWQKAGTDDFVKAAYDATIFMRDDIQKALENK